MCVFAAVSIADADSAMLMVMMVMVIIVNANDGDAQASDVETAKRVADAMVKAMGVAEEAAFKKQVYFHQGYKASNDSAAGAAARLAEREASNLSALAVSLAPETPEAEKAARETAAACAAWTDAFSVELATAVTSLYGHVLPAPMAVANLFYAAACMTGKYDPASLRDASREISWETVRLVRVCTVCLLYECIGVIMMFLF